MNAVKATTQHQEREGREVQPLERLGAVVLATRREAPEAVEFEGLDHDPPRQPISRLIRASASVKVSSLRNAPCSSSQMLRTKTRPEIRMS